MRRIRAYLHQRGEVLLGLTITFVSPSAVVNAHSRGVSVLFHGITIISCPRWQINRAIRNRLPRRYRMSNSSLIVELRKKALETLQESNRMFDGASLLQEASVKEAEQMQGLARAKRADAAWL